jgi:hypothetical protein
VREINIIKIMKTAELLVAVILVTVLAIDTWAIAFREISKIIRARWHLWRWENLSVNERLANPDKKPASAVRESRRTLHVRIYLRLSLGLILLASVFFIAKQ